MENKKIILNNILTDMFKDFSKVENATQYLKLKNDYSDKILNISSDIRGFEDFDEQNYEFAKWVFEKEEGRKPNMNDTKEMVLVAALEVGIRYTRNHI